MVIAQFIISVCVLLNGKVIDVEKVGCDVGSMTDNMCISKPFSTQLYVSLHAKMVEHAQNQECVNVLQAGLERVAKRASI